MTRGIKVLTTVLIIIVGVLAVSTGFFYAENSTLKTQLKANPSEQQQPTDNTTGSNLDQPLDSTSTPTDTTADTSTKDASTVAVPTTSTSSTAVKPSTTTTTTTTSTTTKPAATSAKTYTVKSGDTMSTIASGLGINWLDLAKANGMNENTANSIKIGQVLTVPGK